MGQPKHKTVAIPVPTLSDVGCMWKWTTSPLVLIEPDNYVERVADEITYFLLIEYTEIGRGYCHCRIIKMLSPMEYAERVGHLSAESRYTLLHQFPEMIDVLPTSDFSSRQTLMLLWEHRGRVEGIDMNTLTSEDKYTLKNKGII